MLETYHVIYYLVIVNVVGFLLAAINGVLRKKTRFNIEIPLMIFSFFGSSLGILASTLIFDRKTEKENMMTRVFAVCMLIIHTVLLLFLFVLPKGDLNFDVIGFLSENLWLDIYLGVMNVVTFAIYGIDKYNAVKQRERISILTLLLFSFIGGSLGGISAMYLFQ